MSNVCRRIAFPIICVQTLGIAGCVSQRAPAVATHCEIYSTQELRSYRITYVFSVKNISSTVIGHLTLGFWPWRRVANRTTEPLRFPAKYESMEPITAGAEKVLSIRTGDIPGQAPLSDAEMPCQVEAVAFEDGSFWHLRNATGEVSGLRSEIVRLTGRRLPLEISSAGRCLLPCISLELGGTIR